MLEIKTSVLVKQSPIASIYLGGYFTLYKDGLITLLIFQVLDYAI